MFLSTLINYKTPITNQLTRSFTTHILDGEIHLLSEILVNILITFINFLWFTFCKVASIWVPNGLPCYAVGEGCNRDVAFVQVK